MEESSEAVELMEFQTNLYHRMNKFRQENLLCDVNISINGKLHPCHRLVLMAASPFFETSIVENTEQNSEIPVLKIDEVEEMALEEILNAIYTSRLRLLPENVYFILKSSYYLQLEVITNACIVWIIENTDIHYLIEVCILAKSREEEKLYRKCVDTISQDILRWSKSATFKDIPFDALSDVLKKCDTFMIEEIVLSMIIEWSKFNKANTSNLQTLLDSAKLKDKTAYTSMMSKLNITFDDNDVLNVENAKTTTEEIASDSQFNFSLYVNAVENKTAAKGWGVMKINDTFEKSTMSNFYFGNSEYRKVVQVGTKHFCFETKNNRKRFNVFYCCDECYNRTELNLPDDDVFICFDLAAVGDIIYLLRTDGTVETNVIWMYSYARDAWTKSFEIELEVKRQKSATRCERFYCGSCYYGQPCQVEYETCIETRSALHNYDDPSLACTSSDGILYVFTTDSHSRNIILSFDSRSGNFSFLTNVTIEDGIAAVCAFDNKIALSSFNDIENAMNNSMNIFDITANQWLKGVKPMNFWRESHNLLHHDGCLYAVENESTLIPNEKYDLKANVWTNIPALPKRFMVGNTNEGMFVSTYEIIRRC